MHVKMSAQATMKDFTSSNNDVFPVLLLFANRVQKSPKCGFD